MSKQVTKSIWTVAGTVFLFAAFIPWVLGNFAILAAGSGESVSVRKTGMVTCPHLLRWTEWMPASEIVSHDTRSDHIDTPAEILEYRVGTDKKLFAQLTFYQAKYRLPDGTVAIWSADGPRHLISVNTASASMVSVFFGLLSALCFLRLSRLT